jgi:excinuclease ABC subunit C
MRQVVGRRFAHYLAGDAGFESKPDLLLIDGGITHAAAVREVLEELDLPLYILGMVKDDRHRTRALVTPQGDEIAIVGQQSVFSLIGNIQEETHRFAITYHKALRTKKLRYSELDQIPGIGPKRKQDLLKTFKSISAISSASVTDLLRILPCDAAESVFNYFHSKDEST